jgi:uncharacterized protein (TIGR02145 family)
MEAGLSRLASMPSRARRSAVRVESRRLSVTKQLLAIAPCVVIALVGASCSTEGTVEVRPGSATTGVLMPDGKLWMIENLSIGTADSYCYDDREHNCRRYGRLYTWEAAKQACLASGDGWRLPTDDDWRALARHFGGVFDDAQDRGAGAYHALLRDGRSGFDADLGGGRDLDGQYDDLDAHGFYWTASEGRPATALFYNFGRGSTALYRQPDGEKDRAFAVRCVRAG